MFINSHNHLKTKDSRLKTNLYVCAMENQRTQNKVAMNYGLLFGLSGVAVFLLFYFMGANVQSRWPSYLTYTLLAVFLVMGIKSYRDEDLGGELGYGKAVGTGVLISIYGGIIIGGFTAMFFLYIAPEMTERIIEAAQQNMLDQGMSEDQIEMASSMTRKFMTPMWLFFLSILGYAFTGFIFSLIIGIFLKKEKNPFSSNIG